MVGLRLGGALATLAALDRGDIESMVLWNPVLDGRSYLDELSSLQKEMLRFRPKQRRNQKASPQIEILGFPFSRWFISEIENINLMTLTRKVTRNMLVMQSGPRDNDNSSDDHLNSSATHLECQRLEAPQIWLPTTDGSLLVPAQVLQAIVAWSCESHS